MFAFLNVHKYYVMYVHIFNMFQLFCVYSDFCLGACYIYVNLDTLWLKKPDLCNILHNFDKNGPVWIKFGPDSCY